MTKIFLIYLLTFHNSYALDFALIDQGKQPVIAGTHSIGDLNGDGYNDLFSSGQLGVSIFDHTSSCSLVCYDTVYFKILPQILINNKKGGFEPLIQTNDFDLFPEVAVGDIVNGRDYTQFNAFFSDIADVDNDGDNDIVTSTGRVYLNDGIGNFGSYNDAGYPDNFSHPIYTADVNNDGIVEILTFGRIYQRISKEPLEYAEMPTNYNLVTKANIEIADFDNDGFLDVLSYAENKDIIILFNNQHGDFPNSKIVSLSTIEPLKLVVGDIDNDGYSDIVLSNGNVLKNLQNQSFEMVENILDFQVDNMDPSLEYSLIPRKLIKYNNDDFLDLHVTMFWNDSDYFDMVFINNQQGQFQYNLSRDELINSDIGNYEGISSFSGDFNDDGLEDFVTLDAPPFEKYDTDSFSRYDLSFYSNLTVSQQQLNLNLSDGFARVRATHFNMAPYAEVRLADFDNDERKEILFSSYYNNNDNVSLLHYRPFYLSNFSNEQVVYQNVQMPSFNNSDIMFYSIPIDLNNDNLDDLIVKISCFGDCNSPNLVFINTGNGFVFDEDIIVPNISYDYSVTVLDFNGDGFDDIYSDRDNLIYINENGSGFSEGLDLHIFRKVVDIADINGDGKTDIAYIDENNSPHIVYGNDDLSQIVDDQISTIASSAISFFDYDSDGQTDLYILENNTEYVTQLINTNGNFTVTNRFLFKDSNSSYGGFKVVDLNHDGRVEVISGKAYQLNFNNVFEVLSNESIPSNYVLGDFDDDTFIDIVFRNKALYSRNFSFYTGLSYDPNHSGHGFSIENVGGEQFFTVFYTYDNEGNPEWYTDLGMFEKPREDYWNITSSSAGLIRNEYDYASQTVVQNTDAQYKGSVQHGKCSDNYGKIDLSFEIGVGSFGIPISQGRWCSEPIVDYYLRPQEDFSGLWWAGDGDSGWGWSVSLIARENTTEMVLVLYYYDASGNPRWLIGQQSGFQKGHAITLDMNMVKGYGREYTPVDLTLIPAGTITLTLNQVSHSLSQAGRMSVDVTYPGPEGGNWVRNDIPIALFSKPR